MKSVTRSMAAAVALITLGAAPGIAQEVHEIRMVSAGRGEFRFEPASVAVRRGDVLLFRSESGGPHSVVFEDRGVSAADRERINGAMPRRAGDLSSPLLTDKAEYRVVIPALTAGTYRYFCLPHRAYDMRGEVTVK